MGHDEKMGERLLEIRKLGREHPIGSSADPESKAVATNAAQPVALPDRKRERPSPFVPSDAQRSAASGSRTNRTQNINVCNFASLSGRGQDPIRDMVTGLIVL